MQLLTAKIPAWIKLVWIAIRSFQGNNNYCFASLKTIGERVPNEKGNPLDKSQVSRAVNKLKKEGFLEVDGYKKMKCKTPQIVVAESTITQDELLQLSQRSLQLSQPIVAAESTVVAAESTPSENQQGKPNIKTKKENRVRALPGGIQSYDEVKQSWNNFASIYSLPKIIKLTPDRVAAVRKLAPTIWPVIDQVYEGLSILPFYLGRLPGKTWKVNFDWIWKNEKNYLKILEKADAARNSTPTPKGDGNSTYSPATSFTRIHSIAAAALNPEQGSMESTGSGQ